MFYTLQVHALSEFIVTHSMSSPTPVKHCHCQATRIIQLSPKSDAFFSQFHRPGLFVLQTHQARCLAQGFGSCCKCRLPCFVRKRNLQGNSQPVTPFSQISLPFPIRSEG